MKEEDKSGTPKHYSLRGKKAGKGSGKVFVAIPVMRREELLHYTKEDLDRYIEENSEVYTVEEK